MLVVGNGRAGQAGQNPAGIQVPRLDHQVTGSVELHKRDAEAAVSRDSRLHHIAQRLTAQLRHDLHQLVPVGVRDHPALLLVHTGIALVGAVTFPRCLDLHWSSSLFRSTPGVSYSVGSAINTADMPMGTKSSIFSKTACRRSA